MFSPKNRKLLLIISLVFTSLISIFILLYNNKIGKNIKQSSNIYKTYSINDDLIEWVDRPGCVSCSSLCEAFHLLYTVICLDTHCKNYKSLICYDFKGNKKWDFNSMPLSKLIMDDECNIFTISKNKVLYLSSSGNIIWQYICPGNLEYIIQYNKNLYILIKEGCILCLDTNGTLRWKHNLEKSLYVLKPLVSSEGFIFISSLSGYLYCFDKDGNILWSNNIKEEFGIGNSPLYGNDCFFIYTDKIYCINDHGKILWIYEAGESIRNLSIQYKDGIYYFTDKGIYKLNESGKLIWKKSYIEKSMAPPLFDDIGNLYLCDKKKNRFYSINTDGVINWYLNLPGIIFETPHKYKDSIYFVVKVYHELDQPSSFLYKINMDGTVIFRFKHFDDDMEIMNINDSNQIFLKMLSSKFIYCISSKCNNSQKSLKVELNVSQKLYH